MKNAARIILFIMIFLIFATFTSYATDLSDNFIADSEGIYLATITNITADYIVIEPFTALGSDEVPATSLKVAKFEYSYCGEHAGSFNVPMIGDNIVISLKEESGNTYFVKHGAFKTDVLDYRLLKILVPETMADEDCIGDVVILSYFIHKDAGKIKYLNEGDVVKVVENGAWIPLYPGENQNELINFVDKNGKILTSKPTEDVIDIDTDNGTGIISGIIREQKENNDYLWIIAISVLFIGVILGGGVLYFAARREKKNMLEKN